MSIVCPHDERPGPCQLFTCLCSTSNASDALALDHASAAWQGRGRSTSEGSEPADKLTFLVEMFNKTEAALVADVFRACNGDHDAAMQSLMDMQARAPPAGCRAL